MMSEVKGSRKRNKKSYGHWGSKKHKGSRELQVGMQGVLITCNTTNHRKCTSEAFSLLNEYADQLYGPEKFAEEQDSDVDNDGDDAEAALKKEVEQLRTSTQKHERRFQAVESGASNVTFIQMRDVDPAKLVHHILQDLHTTKKNKSRLILRMLPVSGTCRAFVDDMEKYLSNFLEPWFKTPNCGTFEVVFKARNSSHNKREEIIKVVAGLALTLNPENKVDLTNPKYTIIVEVIKNVCCVSVVEDYKLLKKFNVQEVVKGENSAKILQQDGDGKKDDEIKDCSLKQIEDQKGAKDEIQKDNEDGENPQPVDKNVKDCSPNHQ